MLANCNECEKFIEKINWYRNEMLEMSKKLQAAQAENDRLTAKLGFYDNKCPVCNSTLGLLHADACPLCAARKEVERLRKDIEQLRVQLAACGVAAMCNTAQSRGQQKCAEGDYGWSQSSYQDAVNAVGREIALRDQPQAAQAFAAYLQEVIADKELLVGQERKKVARECIDYVDSHASDCGCSKRIAHDIRERYGVEE